MNQSYLKDIIDYDPLTGLFFWKTINSNRSKIGSIAGSLQPSGYINIRINKRLYRSHRLAFLYMNGEMPSDGAQVDHINGIRNDNRWANLRLVTKSLNMKNQRKRRSNTSGFSNVCRRDKDLAWQVRMKDNNGKLYSRYFTDNVFSGKDLAFMAACFFAVRKRSEFGYHDNHGSAAQ